MKDPVAEAVVEFCEACLQTHGDTPEGVGWRQSDADVRYRVMLDVVRDKGRPCSILDLGCGAAHLNDYIARNGLGSLSYSGLDLSPKFLDVARRKFPSVTFYEADASAADPVPIPEFDYVVANGLFTYKGAASFEAMFDYLKRVVRRAFSVARKGIAFNVMSRQVDWERDDLFHLPVDSLLAFLSEQVSRHVVVRHDYGLYEYTVYVYRDSDSPFPTKALVHARPGPSARPPADPLFVLGNVSLAADEVVALQGVMDASRSRHDVDPREIEALTAHRATAAYERAFTEPEPLVSVCVCTYNRSKLLVERCLTSVLAQDYPRFEVIVVGDGCSDDTSDQVAKLGDSRVRFENLPRETYPEQPFARWMVAGTAATNRAIELARGRFLTHLDDDDEYLPGRIAKLVGFMQRERVEVAFHPFLFGTVEGEWMSWPSPTFASGHVTTGSVMYLDWFGRVRFDPESYRYLEAGDWNRCRRLAHLGARIARYPEPLLRHYAEGSQRGTGVR